MASDILSVGLSGLNAAQAAINTIQNNIANANTPNYHRQTVNLAPASPTVSGGSYFGNGVDVTGVTRSYSQFLDNQVLVTQGQQSYYDIYSSFAGQVDQMLGDSNAGLSNALSNFFGAVNAVANDPTSLANRQNMLGAGSSLTSTMNNLGQSLDSMNQGINQQIGTIVDQVNGYASQIANLNKQIATQGATAGQQPNNLLDQRDQLVAQINQLVNVTTITQSDGSFNLYLGSGQPLVVGTQANTLKAQASTSDPSQTVPYLVTGNSQIPLDASQITGGQLGGLLAVRQEVVQPALDQLGQIAVSLADQFNAQQTAGYDLSGAQGIAFFTAPVTVTQGSGNTGTASITEAVTNGSQLAAGTYTLSFDGTNYTLTGPNGVNNTGTLAQVTQGLGFNLSLASGSPSNADSWTITIPSLGGAATSFSMNSAILGNPSAIAAASTSAGAPGDNTNALAMAQLQNGYKMGSTTTYSDYYNQLVASNASLANQADTSNKAYTTLVQNAQTAQQSVSGVNLDEEAANLIRYQQAYQASARVMQVASSLFNSILSIGQ